MKNLKFLFIILPAILFSLNSFADVRLPNLDYSTVTCVKLIEKPVSNLVAQSRSVSPFGRHLFDYRAEDAVHTMQTYWVKLNNNEITSVYLGVTEPTEKAGIDVLEGYFQYLNSFPKCE